MALSPIDRTSAENSPWVSIPKAAAFYDVSPDTIRRMASRGEIEARRFGPRLIRVNLDDIRAAARSLQYVEPRGSLA